MSRKKRGRITVAPALKRRILDDQDYTCALCGFSLTGIHADVATIDHIIPVSHLAKLIPDDKLLKRVANMRGNLQATCRNCNEMKGAKPNGTVAVRIHKDAMRRLCEACADVRRKISIENQIPEMSYE
ncbi:MAG: HNH endonuclease [Alphaproteobacteria bacterium]